MHNKCQTAKLPRERTPTTGQRPCTVTSDRTTVASLPASHKKLQNCSYLQNRCSQRGTAKVGSSGGNQPRGCDTKVPEGTLVSTRWNGPIVTASSKDQGRLPEGRPLPNDVITSQGTRGAACNESQANSPSSSSDLEGPSRESQTSLSDAVPTFLATSRTISCTSSGMSSRVTAGLEWVLSLAGSRSWSLMTTYNECEGEQTGIT